MSPWIFRISLPTQSRVSFTSTFKRLVSPPHFCGCFRFHFFGVGWFHLHFFGGLFSPPTFLEGLISPPPGRVGGLPLAALAVPAGSGGRCRGLLHSCRVEVGEDGGCPDPQQAHPLMPQRLPWQEAGFSWSNLPRKAMDSFAHKRGGSNQPRLVKLEENRPIGPTVRPPLPASSNFPLACRS